MKLVMSTNPMTDINDFGHNSFVHTKGLKERIQMTEQELLKVLDMSGDEQYIWVINNTDLHKMPEKSLADLAFRLRDEVCKDNHADFHEAIYDIMIKVEGHDNWATAFWGECIAKPIHWIIAALIAMESK